jgi:GH25 family lysozyme M1 (1,4-beta-N-acetylmuramidase)
MKEMTPTKQKIIFFSMLAVILGLTAAVAVMGVKNARLKDDTAARPPAVESAAPVKNERVYDFFGEGESVFFNDGYLGTVMVPALTGVPKANYDYSNLKLEDGRYVYYGEDGEVASKTGIDVSYHQSKIDWKAVAEDGIDFVIIRVGYRGYESGLLNLDQRFNIYVNGAANAGLDVGVYFFSQALTTAEAIEEAEFVLNCLSHYEITYPVVFDWEVIGNDEARTNAFDPETLTECAAAFCDTIADAGYTPMIYMSHRFALLKYDLSKLTDYDIWYCEYKDGYSPPAFVYDFKIWQYADDGAVSGISGGVDMNISFADYGKPPQPQATTQQPTDQSPTAQQQTTDPQPTTDNQPPTNN